MSTMTTAGRGAAAMAMAMAMAIMLGACASPAPGSVLEQAQVDRALQSYELHPEPAELPAVTLGWQAPPEECPHAYRLTASYEPALRFEDDGTASLMIGRHPRQPADHELEPGPLGADEQVPAHLFYQGVRAERVGATRDITITGALLGPASPTAACMPRTWDPMEDALALGWPVLTGRLTGVGEHWNGMRVGGKCSRSVCVDPLTGGGGPETHDLTCVTTPWHEQLAGLYELDGELYAWIYSNWSDGHEAEQGIHTERRTLVSVEHGRPVWSQTRVDHRFAQPVADNGFAPVVRTWTLEAIDACPGSLKAAGWERPTELGDEEIRLRERLADTDALRRATRTDAMGPEDRNALE